MLELLLLIDQPWLLLGAVVGMLSGVGCAVALQNFFPTAPDTVGAIAAAGLLLVGSVLGALWEARRPK